MELLDIHSHRLSEDSFRAILNIRFPEDEFLPEAGRFYSVGVHPWDVTSEERIDWTLLEELVGHPQVLAIGECGMDKQVHAELLVAQERIFLRQLAIAERLGKPLLIHNVKSTGIIGALKKSASGNIPWIQHGFRGKPELALEMLRSGFYLSLGIRYNEDALRVIPLDRLFLETDDSGTDICRVYEKAAHTLGISAAELTKQIQHNIKKVFFNG